MNLQVLLRSDLSSTTVLNLDLTLGRSFSEKVDGAIGRNGLDGGGGFCCDWFIAVLLLGLFPGGGGGCLCIF